MGRATVRREVGIRLAGAVLALAPCVAATPGDPDAQEPGAGPPPDVEVMRVRGRGISAVDTAVPSSITQFDLKEIAALGAQDVSDLARVTPNVEINTLSATSPTFFIRGVGLNDFNANAAGAVAIYADGVPLNAPALQLGQLFDVQNVEVLRGPQGFGDDRNASGGTIRTITHKPSGVYEASLRADFGNHAYRDLEGALSLPIVEDLLASRFAFRWLKRDPFYRNRCGNAMDVSDTTTVVCNETVTGRRRDPVPPGLPDRVNDKGRWAARGLLRLQPPRTEMDWLLNVHGGSIDQDSTLGQVLGTENPSGVTSTGYIDPAVQALFEANRTAYLEQLQDLPPAQRGNVARRLAKTETLDQTTRNIDRADPFANDYDLVGKEKLDTVGGSMRGDLVLWDLVELTTITGAEYYDRSRVTDFDFSSNPSIHLFQDDDAWQFTQNLGFAWEPSAIPAEFGWGGYYLTENLNADSTFELRNPAPRTILQSYKQDLNSFGIYGNFRWDFIDDFALEGGVRFNWEQKNFELLVRNAQATRPVLPVDEREPWSAPTGGLILHYFYSPEVSAYWKYTRGWKAGHFNAGVLEQTSQGTVVSTATPSVADPETIDAFEVGLRGNWLEDRLRIGGALFYYRYADYQVFVIENQFGSPPQLEIINARDARVWGAEVDLQVEPLVGWVPSLFEGLVLSGRFGWIESEFLDFTDTRVATIPAAESPDLILANAVVDFTGNRLPNTPRYKVSGTVEYAFDLGRWGALIPRYDVSWTDDVFFDPSQGRGVPQNPIFGNEELPKYAIGQRDYWVHDARLTFRSPSSRIEVAGWVRNFTNEVYKTYVADTSIAFGSLQNLIGDPRTYGVSISFIY